VFLGLCALRLGERRTEDASTVLEEPSANAPVALLQAPKLRLRGFYFPFCGFERVA
jgi:hypothetical protein